MASRVGKYKLSKRDSALSLADGGNIKGDVALDGHLQSNGTVPTLTTTTAGDGTCTISSNSNDTAGALTFADTWANSDTQLVTFSAAYGSAPLVFLANNGTDTDTGIAAIKYDAVAVTTAGFTITASGTCSGVLNYFVIEVK